MIEIKNLNVSYIQPGDSLEKFKFNSISDFSINLDKNTLFIADEIFSTALFRSIMNIDRFSGTILIDGTKNTEIKRDYPISYLPITPALLKKSVKANIVYPLKIRKRKKQEIEIRFLDLQNQFAIKNFLLKKKLNLSEKKIVALLRAKIREPKYIILENFFCDLDENHISLALNILKSLNSTIIASEKNLTYANLFEDFKIIKK